MNADLFVRLVQADMEKRAFLGGLAWKSLKGLGKGFNWGATGAVSTAGKAGGGLVRSIARHPMRTANIAFPGAIVAEGAFSPPRVTTRTPSIFQPRLPGGGR